ncbi:MAG: O-antigen ligase family protein, partial [Phycisphaerales bacterium]
MTKQPTNPVTPKSKKPAYLEYVLLGLCLCVIALRCTYTEGPPMQATTLAANLSDNVYSLSVSAVLLLSFIVWIVYGFWSARFSYRITGIEIGLGIFCVAAVISGFAAPDKRLAITDVAVFIAPIIMALLLIQILDSNQKIRLVLVVIAALGAVSAYQCAEQFFVSNQLTIEQYEQEPKTMLEPLGIEPGTFQQFLFEHRLYSRGIRGFFTTRNSAGSFALMALFAGIVLLVGKSINRKTNPASFLYLLACCCIVAIILLSLVLTRSKGAFIGLFLAVLAFGVIRAFGKCLKTHRKTVLVGSMLLCAAGVSAIALHGLKNDRLPGGGSMLVRWQYWRSSARMYADSPLTGVGPGNFGHFYPHYKPAAALESVSNPHNFPLSILTQYGPLGLLGFLAMLFIPVWRMTSPGERDVSAKTADHQPAFQKVVTVFVIVVSAALLVIRPILMAAAQADTFDVIVYLIVTVYVAPVAVFFIAFVLLAGPLRKEQQQRVETPNTNTPLLLFCAVLAVALHNLIDFAIFEPGVLTTFWAMFACLIAANSLANPLFRLSFKSAAFTRLLAVAGAVLISLVYLSYVLLPVARSAASTKRANLAVSVGQFEDAHEFSKQATAADPLSASAPAFNGRLYLHRFGLKPGNDRDLLLRAADCLQTAIKRNGAAFKNFERLTDVYAMLAETSPGQERADWLDKAFETASEAVNRYGGCGRLHFKLAQIAEQSA